MATPLRRIVGVVERPLVDSPLSMFYGHLVNWEVLECGHEGPRAGSDALLEEAAPAPAVL